jgi:hypothetical protein
MMVEVFPRENLDIPKHCIFVNYPKNEYGDMAHICPCTTGLGPRIKLKKKL